MILTMFLVVMMRTLTFDMTCRLYNVHEILLQSTTFIIDLLFNHFVVDNLDHVLGLDDDLLDVRYDLQTLQTNLTTFDIDLYYSIILMGMILTMFLVIMMLSLSIRFTSTEYIRQLLLVTLCCSL